MFLALSSLCGRITDARYFQVFIIFVILLNAIVIGLETYPSVAQLHSDKLHLIDKICLGIFVVEILLKLIACGEKPLLFFHSGWNSFDLIVVAAAFIPGLQGQSTLLRLIRLLRVLRLLSAMPGLQILVIALIDSVPRIIQMAILASLLFYIYAVIGQSLFNQHDPEHWETLHISLLSLFRILTLEDWTDLMYTGMQLYSWSWIFFVTFVLFATFIVFNMLIGIILNSMEEARITINNEQLDTSGKDIRLQLRDIQAKLSDLEKSIETKLEKIR